LVSIGLPPGGKGRADISSDPVPSRRDIRWQFLIEALMLALLGGLVGALLGATAAVAIAWEAGWPILISPWAIILACGFAGFVGIHLASIQPIEQRSSIPSWHCASNRSSPLYFRSVKKIEVGQTGPRLFKPECPLLAQSGLRGAAPGMNIFCVPGGSPSARSLLGDRR
jgi:hypothetical protein